MRKKSNDAVMNVTETSLHECILTGAVIADCVSPLRLIVTDGVLDISLNSKMKNNAIFIDSDPSIIKALVRGERRLPDLYHSLIDNRFYEHVIQLYHKKFYETLGFLLKSGQAIIGRRAIDRSIMSSSGDILPFAILKSPNGSEAICNSFKFKKRSLQIITLDSDTLLQSVTARSTISYCCIMGSPMGIGFINDYLRYLKFTKH